MKHSAAAKRIGRFGYGRICNLYNNLIPHGQIHGFGLFPSNKKQPLHLLFDDPKFAPINFHLSQTVEIAGTSNTRCALQLCELLVEIAGDYLCDYFTVFASSDFCRHTVDFFVEGCDFLVDNRQLLCLGFGLRCQFFAYGHFSVLEGAIKHLQKISFDHLNPLLKAVTNGPKCRFLASPQFSLLSAYLLLEGVQVGFDFRLGHREVALDCLARELVCAGEELVMDGGLIARSSQVAVSMEPLLTAILFSVYGWGPSVSERVA